MDYIINRGLSPLTGNVCEHNFPYLKVHNVKWKHRQNFDKSDKVQINAFDGSVYYNFP